METLKVNVIMVKSYSFALDIISHYKSLIVDHKEYVLSKQILRSGTAIGALVKEPEHAESRSDFRHKFNIALKEANETLYWLDLEKESGYIQHDKYLSLNNKCNEIISILVKIVKTLKKTSDN